MGASMFPVLSLDRAVVRWEEHVHRLSPVEEVDGMLFKREDRFAPLGYGGVNGTKVRQILWLVRRYLDVLPAGARPGLILAGSVRSPQLGRVAVVARHLGLPCALVIGSELRTAIRHENVQIAATFGAEFHRANAPYNPALQRRARELRAGPRAAYYLMEYGLSVEGPDERVEAFYRFGAEQVGNLPGSVETVLMPAGSCNATLGLLYGIARRRPRALRRVVLFGIGPTRIEWFEERLRVIERASGVSVRALFRRDYRDHPGLTARFNAGVAGDAPYELRHHDLHSTGYATYQDEMPERRGDVDLHPTYEGKVMRFLRERPALFDRLGRAMFWVVGSEPTWAAMERAALPFLRAAS